MAKMKCIFIFLTFISCSLPVFSSRVPALIWSPHRSLVDLPASLPGHTVSTHDFQSQYLSVLLQPHHNTLVIFIQDKLSLEDFSHFADVYNTAGTGGAFHNIKKFLDTTSSLELHSVKSPLSDIENVLSSAGRVHSLRAPFDVNNLRFRDGEENVVLVHLPRVRAGHEEASFTESDGLVGNILSDLSNRDIQYTAMYTAHTDLPHESEKLKYYSRHLLASAGESNRSVFANISSCMFFYAKGIDLTVTRFRDKKFINVTNIMLPTATVDVAASSCGVNKTEPSVLVLTFKPENSTISSVKMTFTFMQDFYLDWHLENLTFTYTGKLLNDSIEVIDMKIDMITSKLKKWLLWSPKEMSYHCTAGCAWNEARNATWNDDDDDLVAGIAFDGIQVQPFRVRREKFGASWDCVGFFTPAIWMGIFSGFILLVILFYGLYMISTITAMDRFDDPKGKTITINATD